MPRSTLTLGIETSCDETSAAVVEGERRIRSNIVASQFDLHARYGGVVPELACRRHVEVISQTVESALDEAGAALGDVGLISVVKGPGLIGALLVGVSFAKALARSLDLPIVGVNHVEAHLYSAVMSNEGVEFPAVGLVVSGGHTMLFLMEDFGQYRWLAARWTTRWARRATRWPRSSACRTWAGRSSRNSPRAAMRAPSTSRAP